MSERNQVRFTGVVCVVLGASVWMIALRVIPYEESKVHAPEWILLLCGSLFSLGGLALIFKSHPLVVNVLGNLIVLAFAIIAVWIALFGASEQFSGGVPLLARELNVGIGRVVFGACSVLCALMLIPGIRHTFRRLRKEDSRN